METRVIPFNKPKGLFKDDLREQGKEIRVYTSLWKIHLVNLKKTKLSASETV